MLQKRIDDQTTISRENIREAVGIFLRHLRRVGLKQTEQRNFLQLLTDNRRLLLLPQIAEQLWTHGFPVGPKGRFAPFLPYFLTVWNFSKNKEAAKSLILHLSQATSAEKLVAASGGYDLPAFEKLTTFKTWAEETHRAAHTVWYLRPADEVLDDRYLRDVLPTLDRQLGVAGLRLARFLNAAFGSNECPPH